MRLLITRHAQTEDNEKNVIQGGDSKISEKGIVQIDRLINRLKKEKIDLIVSSDFGRCKVTSEKIAKLFSIPVEYNTLLREKNDGDWIGKNVREINWDSLEGSFETRHAPNGESLVEVCERARKALKSLIENYGETEKTILIVSHGTFLRLAVGNLIGLTLHDSIFNIILDNCSLSEIDVNKRYKKGYLLKYLNDSDFLL